MRGSISPEVRHCPAAGAIKVNWGDITRKETTTTGLGAADLLFRLEGHGLGHQTSHTTVQYSTVQYSTEQYSAVERVKGWRISF